MKIKKFFALLVATALVVVAPGLEPYQAFAASLTLPGENAGALHVASAAAAPNAPSADAAATLPAPDLDAAAPAVVGDLGEVSPQQDSTLNALTQRQTAVSASLGDVDLSAEGAAIAAASLINGDSEDKRPAGDDAAPPQASLSGKTLLLIGSKKGRGYLVERPLELAKKHGFNVILLDDPSRKDEAIAHGLSPENFVAADVDNHGADNIKAIVAQANALAGTRAIDAVLSLVNAPVLLAAHGAESLKLPGNPAAAVLAAMTKDVARSLMNKDAALEIPAQIVASPEAAAAAFNAMKARGFERVVLKPASGGGGAGVELDIDSPEKAAATYVAMIQAIEDLNAKDPAKAKSKNMDQRPSILMEGQIGDGITLDVEMLLQNGEVVWHNPSRNPPPHRTKDGKGVQETGTTYGKFLTPAQEKNVGEIAAKAVKAIGLRQGSVHLEAVYNRNGTQVVEVNPRMGGADVWENTLESTGVDLIEQQILAAFGVPIAPQSQAGPLLKHAFLIPAASGKVISIEGVEKIRQDKDVFNVVLHKTPGKDDSVSSIDDGAFDSFDYIGYVTVRGEDEGKTTERLLSLLDQIKIRIQKADGTIVEQTGAYGQNKVLAKDEQRLLKGGIWALPNSFLFGYIPGWSVSSMGQELLAVGLPVFTGERFKALFHGQKIIPVMISGAIELICRIPGAWFGKFLAKNFDPKWINNVSLIALALSGFVIPIASWQGASDIALFKIFLANSAVAGFIYGITRGITEKLLPPLIIGKGKDKQPLRKLGLDLAVQPVELISLSMAYAADPLLNMTSGPILVAIGSGLVALATVFYGLIKYVEPWTKPVEEKPIPSDPQKGGRVYSWKEFIPYLYVRNTHFNVYKVLAYVPSVVVFNSTAMQGKMIASYDFGSWAGGFLGATMLPKLSQKTWTAIAIAGSMLFFWSTYIIGNELLAKVMAGFLGGLITNVTNELDSYYADMNQSQLANFSKLMMTFSTLAVLPLFLPFVALALFPALGAYLSMSTMYLGVLLIATLYAAITAFSLFSLNGKSSK